LIPGNSLKSGNFPTGKVATLARNGGNFGPEWVAVLLRNMHKRHLPSFSASSNTFAMLAWIPTVTS